MSFSLNFLYTSLGSAISNELRNKQAKTHTYRHPIALKDLYVHSSSNLVHSPYIILFKIRKGSGPIMGVIAPEKDEEGNIYLGKT